jgi:hypothetical protein
MMKKMKFFLVFAAAIALGCVLSTCSLDTAPRVNVTLEDPSGGNSTTVVAIEKGSSMGGKMPTAANFTREGPYVFYGWFAGQSQYLPSTPIGADITLIARWSDDIATVSFAFTQKDAGGNDITPRAEIPAITAIKGIPLGPLAFPATPQAQGWQFDTWVLNDEDFTTATPVPASDNVTLTARWVPKQVFTVTFNPGPGVTPIAPMQVYAGECIDEWVVRFPPKPTSNPVNAQAFFVAWLDDENRHYDGQVPIRRNLTITGRWGLPPYIVDLQNDIDSVASSEVSGNYGTTEYDPVVREAWDSTAENPKWVVVNQNAYTPPYNENRWRILYRIAFKDDLELNVGFYTRYTIRARFYANTQATTAWTEGGFQPNNLAEEAGYSEAGLLKGVNSQSDDGWGQISWTLVANWNGQGADAETMLQRYNLDRKGGTINDTWVPARGQDLDYPPFLLIQTSDNYIGHIEVYQIVFHNGEWEHTAYEGEEPPEEGAEE